MSKMIDSVHSTVQLFTKSNAGRKVKAMKRSLFNTIITKSSLRYCFHVIMIKILKGNTTFSLE